MFKDTDMELPYKRGFGFIVNSDELHQLTTLKLSQSLHRHLYGPLKHFFQEPNEDVSSGQLQYTGTSKQYDTTRQIIWVDKHIQDIKSRCKYLPQYVTISYKWRTNGADSILDSSQIERLRRALALLSKGDNTSFILWFDRVFSEAVKCTAEWAWKGTYVYRCETAIMLDSPGTIFGKAGLGFWRFVEHVFAGTEGRQYLQSYLDDDPCWMSVADCNPEDLIFAVFRYGLTSYGKGRINWGGTWGNAHVSLIANMRERSCAFERKYIDVICRYVFPKATHCFSVLPNCKDLARIADYVSMEQIEMCAGQAEIVLNDSGLFIQFPSREAAFYVEHVCGTVYHIRPKQLELQSGKRISERDGFMFGQDNAINVGPPYDCSPWTRDKLRFLDQKPYGDHTSAWNTDFIEEFNGYRGMKISIRTLQPFAEIRRNDVSLYVDAFSIDAGARGSKLLRDYSSATHEPIHGDLSAWEKAQEEGLLGELESRCPYRLVLHRAVWIPRTNICIVELGVVNQRTLAGCPTEDLKADVSKVLDHEALSTDYVGVGVTLKYVIHMSVNNVDIDGEELVQLYAIMETVNRDLNNGRCPSETRNMDWLMAAKVMQRGRRDGRFRWAATMGKALSNEWTGARHARIARWQHWMTVARRVVFDILVRDAHRVLGLAGGVTTIVVGAIRSDWGVVSAGITLTLAAMSSGTKKVRAGLRSATREVVISSGVSFAEEGGCYGPVVQREGSVKTPLEVGVLEFLGYAFFKDVSGNVMCVMPNGEVRGCVVWEMRVHMEQTSATDVKLLRGPADLPSDALVGGKKMKI